MQCIGYLVLGWWMFFACGAKGQTLAFPGAEGFGRFTTGGRGGEVIYVTNLNDHGPGSLRAAINAVGARYILFKVSGTIELKSDLEIKNGDLTIAGQTAPGDGITIRNYSTSIEASNVIIRFLRFRMGDAAGNEGDALGGRYQEDIMIDHCSISWATDENASFYSNENFTMQWCIISESLNNSIHHKGIHGYGGIWGGAPATFHHNLLAHNNSRNPRFSGSSTTSNSSDELTDFRNNVIYNWYGNSTYGGESPGRFNMVNNYYKAGPATPGSKQYRIIEPYEPYGSFYIDGNYVVGSNDITEDNWNGGVQYRDGGCPEEEIRQQEPFDFQIGHTHTAQKAYRKVLAYAGVSLHRDSVDVRIIKEVRNGTATYEGSKTGLPGIIDSQEDVGGWPELESKPAPTDTDKDGMPDNWEEKKGLNPNEPNTNGHDLSEVYCNVEVYLHSLVKNITNNEY